MEYEMNKENEMRVSQTIDGIASYGIGNGFWGTLLERCDEEEFDLDDFLFEIWMETKDND
jgi:hypothetical protein